MASETIGVVVGIYIARNAHRDISRLWQFGVFRGRVGGIVTGLVRR